VTSAPVEPPRSRFVFSPDDEPDDYGRVAVGGDLAPGTLLAAYRNGLFPMDQSGGQLTWWSPDPRGVLPLDGLRVSRSLRRSLRRFELRVDTAFEAVLHGCAREGEDGSWITPEFREAYLRLHHLGWAHSVETWTPSGELVGGLYGVAVGGLFAGESMFHRSTDASKVALAGLVDLLRRAGHAPDRLLDVQWWTPHLGTLGTVEIPREKYLRRLRVALALPPPRFG
jgi:leucyl/phenylalanyl-tRNA---protein transferase